MKGGNEKKEVKSLSHVSHSLTHTSINTHRTAKAADGQGIIPPLSPPPSPQTGHWSFTCVPVIPAQCAGVFADLVCPHLLSVPMASGGLQNAFRYYLNESTPGIQLALQNINYTSSSFCEKRLNPSLLPRHNEHSTCLYLSAIIAVSFLQM